MGEAGRRDGRAGRRAWPSTCGRSRSATGESRCRRPAATRSPRSSSGTCAGGGRRGPAARRLEPAARLRGNRGPGSTSARAGRHERGSAAPPGRRGRRGTRLAPSGGAERTRAAHPWRAPVGAGRRGYGWRPGPGRRGPGRAGSIRAVRRRPRAARSSSTTGPGLRPGLKTEVRQRGLTDRPGSSAGRPSEADDQAAAPPCPAVRRSDPLVHRPHLEDAAAGAVSRRRGQRPPAGTGARRGEPGTPQRHRSRAAGGRVGRPGRTRRAVTARRRAARRPGRAPARAPRSGRRG